MINKARLQAVSSSLHVVLIHIAGAFSTQGLKGCIVFTSSSAGFIPNPFAAMCLWLTGRGENGETNSETNSGHTMVKR
jgi:hypothetical protein